MKRGVMYGTALSKAVTVQMRVFADLAYRCLEANGRNASSYAAYTRHGLLVVAARGSQAAALEEILDDVGIVPQRDKPEHIDP